MEILARNLWKIFEIAREENNDGDNFNPDMTVADDLFIASLEGRKDCDYKCMKDVDKAALLKEWNKCDKVKAKLEYDALVVGRIGYKKADRYKELCDAFKQNDKVKFSAAVISGLQSM